MNCYSLVMREGLSPISMPVPRSTSEKDCQGGAHRSLKKLGIVHVPFEDLWTRESLAEVKPVHVIRIYCYIG